MANNLDSKSFTDLWAEEEDPEAHLRSLPIVLQNFTVRSTDPSFDCSRLDALRSETVAFPGAYSCQGHTLNPPKDAASALLLVSWNLPFVVAVTMMAFYV